MGEMEAVVGVETAKVEDAKSELEQAKTHLLDWIDENDGVAGKVVDGWDSDASAEFAEVFSQIKVDMETIPDCIQGFYDWADGTQLSYGTLDQKITDRMSQLRG